MLLYIGGSVLSVAVAIAVIAPAGPKALSRKRPEELPFRRFVIAEAARA